MNVEKYHQICYLKIFMNMKKVEWRVRWVIGDGGVEEGAGWGSAAAAGGAGEGAVGRRRRWSGGGCGGSAYAFKMLFDIYLCLNMFKLV